MAHASSSASGNGQNGHTKPSEFFNPAVVVIFVGAEGNLPQIIFRGDGPMKHASIGLAPTQIIDELSTHNEVIKLIKVERYPDADIGRWLDDGGAIDSRD